MANTVKLIVGLFAVDKRRGFWGSAHQLISRFTWELPQTLYGLVYGYGANLIGHVHDAGYVNGVTYLYMPDTKEPYLLGNILISTREEGNSFGQSPNEDGFQGNVKLSRILGPIYFLAQIIDGLTGGKSFIGKWQKHLNFTLHRKFLGQQIWRHKKGESYELVRDITWRNRKRRLVRMRHGYNIMLLDMRVPDHNNK